MWQRLKKPQDDAVQTAKHRCRSLVPAHVRLLSND